MNKGLHLFHATSYKNLKSILKTSEITLYPKGKNDKMLEDSSGFIFSQLVFDDIPKYYKSGQLHWIGECVIELDMSLLKDFKFIICNIGGFEHVKDVSKHSLKNLKKDVYAYGNGNLKKLPTFKNVKKDILENISKLKKMGRLAYMHSHEVLLMNNIPLSRCKRIIVYDDRLYMKINNYIKKNKINDIDVLLLPWEAQTDTELFIKEINE